jgi:formate hydrogenlyase transcriptional activator
MVEERQFRADLFYRLNVFPIMLPALRDRREDIPLLARHFVRQLAWRMGKEIPHLTDEVLATLRAHSWPGNIRELQNILERAMILSSGPVLQLSRSEPGYSVQPVQTDRPSVVRTLADAQREHITEALRQAGGVIGGRDGAAARMGLPRTTLLYRMQKLGVTTPQ